MISFQEETFLKAYEDASKLLTSHWEELAVNKDERPLDVDINGYLKAEEANMLKVYTLRDDGNLIGYATFFVRENLHYKTWIVATCDIYYVDPSYRKYGVGFKFFNDIVSELLKMNVRSIYVHDKLSHSHAELFQALGFKAIEQTYEKVI